MLHAARGLTGVATNDLKKGLSAVHRGVLRCPLSIPELARVGLQHCATEMLDALRDLDETGVRAVLVAVIAERLAQEERERQALRE